MNSRENPFYLTTIIPDEYFCDRKEETRTINRLIQNGNNVTIYSPRRMGKTGLIYHCFGRDELKGYYKIFVDLLSTNNLQEFTYFFGNEVFNTLKSKGSKMLGTLLGTLKSLTGKFGIDEKGLPSFNISLGDITNPKYTLGEIFNCIENADKPCIIAFDEFQQVAKYEEKNIEALLRTYIQKSQNCRFIFSGSESHLLQEMFSSQSRPFFQSTSSLSLGQISKTEYCKFAAANFEKFGRKAEMPAIESIYDLMDGHTYYMQKIMNEVFSLSQSGDICNSKMFEASLARIIDMEDNSFSTMIGRRSLKQKLLLYAIACERNAAQITSEEFISKYNLNSASSVQYAAGVLIKDSLISRVIRNGEAEYCINNKFFEIWLCKKYGHNNARNSFV